MDHPINQWIGNAVGGGAILASVIGYVPGFAAAVALVWYLIQIYESATAQRWLASRRIRKLARLKAQVIMLEAHSRAAALPPSKPPPDDSGLPMKPL